MTEHTTAEPYDEFSSGTALPFEFSMAFQPIVDVAAQTVYAYEALVRGPRGEAAPTVLGQVTPANRHAFDQRCRVRALELATGLGLANTDARLSINIMPGAVHDPVAGLQQTLNAASAASFPFERLIFELTETEEVRDFEHLRDIVTECHRRGIKMAIDDFGAGYAGLNLLANFEADIVKIDMELVRNVSMRPVALAIVQSIVQLARTLGCVLVAEGVETFEEYTSLRACGIDLMQGYLLARPAFEALPAVSIPRVARRRRLRPVAYTSHSA